MVSLRHTCIISCCRHQAAEACQFWTQETMSQGSILTQALLLHLLLTHLRAQAGCVLGTTLLLDFPFPAFPDNMGHWVEILAAAYSVLLQGAWCSGPGTQCGLSSLLLVNLRREALQVALLHTAQSGHLSSLVVCVHCMSSEHFLPTLYSTAAGPHISSQSYTPPWLTLRKDSLKPACCLLEATWDMSIAHASAALASP